VCMCTEGIGGSYPQLPSPRQDKACKHNDTGKVTRYHRTQDGKSKVYDDNHQIEQLSTTLLNKI
jgi:hypothetical protein